MRESGLGPERAQAWVQPEQGLLGLAQAQGLVPPGLVLPGAVVRLLEPVVLGPWAEAQEEPLLDREQVSSEE